MTGIEITILALLLALGIALVISGHRDENAAARHKQHTN